MPALTAKRRAHAADMGSFLPRYVLRKPKVEMAMPYMEQLTTAVLFADVSGFTKLSEKLAHKGGRGAAEIAAYLAGRRDCARDGTRELGASLARARRELGASSARPPPSPLHSCTWPSRARSKYSRCCSTRSGSDSRRA